MIRWIVLVALAGLALAEPAGADATADSAKAIRAALRANQLKPAEARTRAWLATIPAGADTARGVAYDVLLEVMFAAGPWSPPQLAEGAEIVRFKERLYGPDHPEVARSLHYQAFMLFRAQEWDQAVPLAERALAIRERRPPDADLIRSLHLLAGLREEASLYEEAERLYDREQALTDSIFGPESSQMANTLNSRAILYRKTGRFSEARPIYERALALRIKTLGPDAVDVGWSYHNYGNFLLDMGDAEAAIAAHTRGIEIREKPLGPDHPGVLSSYNNLALAEAVAGDTAQALAHHRHVLEARRRVLAPGAPDIAQSLENLGTLTMMHGDFAGADSLLEQAVAIYEKAHGPAHERTAMATTNLAELRWRAGDPAEAIRLYERGLAAEVAALGPDHPEVARTTEGLAMARHVAGQDSAAFEDALRAEAISTRHLRRTARVLEERAALEYAGYRVSGLDLALGLLRTLPPSADRARRAFDARVRSRAVVLDEMADRHHAVLASGDPEALRLADSLQDAREHFARLASAGRDSARIAQARDRKEGLEAALAQRSATFRERLATAEAGAEQVRAALPPRSVLVAYARYADPDREGAYAYAAFVTPAGAATRFVDLGPAVTIEKQARSWIAAARKLPIPIRRITAEKECTQLGAALRKTTWDPLAGAIGAAERVFIVPDGALHSVNFGALPAPTKGYMVELDPVFQLLSAERDLMKRRAAPAAAARVLALGGPDFDDAKALAEPAPDAQVAALGPATATDPRALVFRGSLSNCEDFRTLHFDRLPGAEREVEDVAKLWREIPGGDVLALDGANASEAAFRRYAPGRQIVHLATHGIFLGTDCAPAKKGGSVLRQSPLLRSGVALAGANRRGDETAADDGILTAEEIASLDLDAAEWVVLSGCETGRGEIADDEGVLGMRRAFEVAGAHTTVMSLWPVDDAATREWMRALHRAGRDGGLDGARATRDAARAVLKERRAKGYSSHPAAWGAFVAAGR